MTSFEQLPDSSGNYGGEEFMRESVYMSVLMRHNERAAETGVGEEKQFYDDSDFTLTTAEQGNIISLRLNGKNAADNQASGYMPIAYHSPIYNEFVGIPELISADEMGALRRQISDAREGALASFDNCTGPDDVRIDYSHPRVQSIHIRQQRVLYEDDFVERIFKRHNFGAGNSPVYIDEYTSVGLCLTPLIRQDRGRKYPCPERFMAFRLMGAVTEKNGHEYREMLKVIPLAYRPPGSPENDSLDDFAILTGDGEGWIVNDELEVLKALAAELQVKQFEMKLDGLDFDTEKLGINARPKKPQKLAPHKPDEPLPPQMESS